MVVIPVVVLLLLAVIYLITEQTRYQSSARLTVLPAGSRVNSDINDSGLLANFLYTQTEKIKSREILALALAQPISAEENLPAMTGKQVRDLETFKDSEEAPLKTIKNFTNVSVGKKDEALTVTYESPFKNEAPIIANAIIQAFMDYQTQPKQSNVSKLLAAYDDQRQQAEADVKQIAEKMSVLEARYGVLSNNGNDNLAIRQLSSLSFQLAAAHADTLKAKADADDAMRIAKRDPRLIEGNSVVGVVSADDEQVLRANLTMLQASLADVRSHYLPDHPIVHMLQQKVDQAAANYCEAVSRRYLRAKTAEDDLQSQYDKQQKRAMEVSEQAAAYGHLKDDSDRAHRYLETLDMRIHGVELQQTATALDIDFFEHADPLTAYRSHPSRTRAFSLALFLGLILGAGMAMLRDWADDRLHSPDEIKSSLNISLLGAIPTMSEGAEPVVCGQKVVAEPNGEIGEAFRSIRTAIQFGAPKDRCKTMLVTSPSAGDGKSTSAANLAAVMAQSGKKVLLIDANLRNPSLNAIFGLKEGRLGLSSLLNGKGTWDQSIQGGGVDGLHILACGPKVKNPSELLNNPMFSELLEMAAEKYDHIVIDSPPVMGLADARIIAANCDLTILVLRAEKSTRKVASLARDGLTGVGARILGVIVNDVSRHQADPNNNGYKHPTARREPEPAVKAGGRTGAFAPR